VTWLRLHAACAAWALAGAALGLGVAHAQDVAAVPATGDAGLDLALRAAASLGLPGVAASVAWWLRGVLSAGLTVRLSDEDRELLRALKRE
jgi:hypothetical protein